jgi:hypothetical protein
LLELALECEEYRALPYSGGVMDQPAGLLKKMRQVNNVYQSFKLYKAEGKKPGETAKWKKEHSGVWEIVSQVEKLRKRYG